jgi:hypothetical protein
MGFFEFCYNHKKKITSVTLIIACLYILISTEMGNNYFSGIHYSVSFFACAICYFVNFCIIEVKPKNYFDKKQREKEEI